MSNSFIIPRFFALLFIILRASTLVITNSRYKSSKKSSVASVLCGSELLINIFTPFLFAFFYKFGKTVLLFIVKDFFIIRIETGSF